MMYRYMISVLFFGAMMIGCSSSETKNDTPAAASSVGGVKDLSQYGSKVTGADLKNMLSGHAVVGKDLYKSYGAYQEWRTEYHTDGTNASASKSGYKDTGKWVIENDQLCQQFTYFHQGKRWCVSAYLKDGTITYIGEKLEATAHIEK